MKTVDDLTNLEFDELLRSCVERLEREKHYHVSIEGAYTDCLIIIDNDDEVNNQIPNRPFKKWFEFCLMLCPTKHIKL